MIKYIMAFNPNLTKFQNIKSSEKTQENISITDEEIDFWDYIRVTNVRGEEDYRSSNDETIIIGHRMNPILGNKHVMKNQSREERERVIKEHKKDLDEDLKNKGQIWQLLQEIAYQIVEHKTKFAIECWCKPLPCHNDLLIPVIIDMAKEISLTKKTQKKNKIK